MASVCLFVMFYPHFPLHHEVEACDVFCDHEHGLEYLNGEVDEDDDKSYDCMMRDKIKHDKLIMTAMMIMSMMMLTGPHHRLVPPKSESSSTLYRPPCVPHDTLHNYIYTEMCLGKRSQKRNGNFS